MVRRAPIRAIRKFRNWPCSGASCIPDSGLLAVSSRKRASRGGSRNETARIYSLRSSERPVVSLLMQEDAACCLVRFLSDAGLRVLQLSRNLGHFLGIGFGRRAGLPLV